MKPISVDRIKQATRGLVVCGPREIESELLALFDAGLPSAVLAEEPAEPAGPQLPPDSSSVAQKLLDGPEEISNPAHFLRTIFSSFQDQHKG